MLYLAEALTVAVGFIFWRTSPLILMNFEVVLKQFKLKIRTQLKTEIFVIRASKRWVTDCIQTNHQLQRCFAVGRLRHDLVQT